MRRRCVPGSLTLVVALAVVTVVAADDPGYELTAVERKVFRDEPGPPGELTAHSMVAAGDVLRTGAKSAAEILCRDAEARFRLGARTRARLASPEPGVLVFLEEGRLRAVLGRQSGVVGRRGIATPAALLTMRDSEYGVEVDGKGTTTIVVFAGEVEVAPRQADGESVYVGRGQYTEVRPGEPPRPPIPHDMIPAQWDQGGAPEDVGQ